MNEHRQSAHGASITSSEELQSFQTCLATKSGPRQSFQEVKVLLTPVVEDFRTESIFEHKVGLLKWDSLFNEGEGHNLPIKSMFHCVEDGINPYFEEVVTYLGLANQACRQRGCELLRQQMMRNEEGTTGAKSFKVIQEGSARHYAANIASVVFFAKKCPWDSSGQVLTNARTIIHSLLFEPRVAISQTYMLRYVRRDLNSFKPGGGMEGLKICHTMDMSQYNCICTHKG
jgi:hypothetical protein